MMEEVVRRAERAEININKGEWREVAGIDCCSVSPILNTLVQSQQWEDENSERNLCKVDNKKTQNDVIDIILVSWCILC